jgi:hypothetical protein
MNTNEMHFFFETSALSGENVELVYYINFKRIQIKFILLNNYNMGFFDSFLFRPCKLLYRSQKIYNNIFNFFIIGIC